MSEIDFNSILQSKIMHCTNPDILNKNKLFEFIEGKKFSGSVKNMDCQRCLYRKFTKAIVCDACMGTLGELWFANLLSKHGYNIIDMSLITGTDMIYNTPDIVIDGYNFEVKVLNFSKPVNPSSTVRKTHEVKNILEVSKHILKSNRHIKWKNKDYKQNKNINVFIVYKFDLYYNWVSNNFDVLSLMDVNYIDKNCLVVGIDNFDFDNVDPIIYQCVKKKLIEKMIDDVGKVKGYPINRYSKKMLKGEVANG